MVDDMEDLTQPYEKCFLITEWNGTFDLAIEVGTGVDEGSDPDPGTDSPDAGNGISANGIDYAWSYGGSITEADGVFTVTPYTANGITYVIDTLVVDGAEMSVDDPTAEVTVEDAASSVFASFAYTLNFDSPAGGMLSVSRGGIPLTSGSVVRGGEILTVTAPAGYAVDTLTGMTDNGNGTYTVTAQNGEPTPAFTLKEDQAVAEKVATPAFSPAAGAVASGTQVSISCATPDASVYYTTDGSTPTKDSALYAVGAITVTGAMTVKAVAVKDGFTDSDAATAAYTISAAKYSLSVGDDYGGRMSFTNRTVGGNNQITEASAGDLIEVRYFFAPAGYELDYLTYTYEGADGSVTEQADIYSYRFTMPAADITVDAHLKKASYDVIIGGPNFTYSLSVGGTVLAADKAKTDTGNDTYNKAAKAGDTVTFSFEPNEGHVFDGIAFRYGLGSTGSTDQTLDYSCDEGTGLYTFTMPEGRAGISVTTIAKHSVTVAEGITGGTVVTDAVDGYITGILTVTSTPDEGYRLNAVYYSFDGGATWTATSATAQNVTFTPNADVLIKAEFIEGETDVTLGDRAEFDRFVQAVMDGDKHVGATVTLDCDIALGGEWTPIAGFEGIFDGGGHTVSGLQITRTAWDENDAYVGLFAAVNEVRDLTVSGSIDVANPGVGNFYYIGGVAGTAKTLTNCVNMADISAGFGNIGGLAGEIRTASGCVNYGAIAIDEEARWVGGITGHLSAFTVSGVIGAMSNCVNYGDITFISNRYVHSSLGVYQYTCDNPSGRFGGLVGETYGNVTVENSANKGSITGHMMIAGGLVGDINRTLTLKSCYNLGAVSETGDCRNRTRVRLGGLVGTNHYSGGDINITDCYSTGAVTTVYADSVIADELHGWNREADAPSGGSGGSGVVTVTNSYGPSQKASITADAMGGAYQSDTNGINGGFPLLSWETAQVGEDTFAAAFSVTPATASITVYSDAAMTAAVGTGASYELRAGTWYYKITADGYQTETGSFTISVRPVSITAALRQAAQVTFKVSPADAGFTLTDGTGNPVRPDSGGGGTYVFSLYTGALYTYTASAAGYNGVTREYTVPGNDTVTVTLTQSDYGREENNYIYGDGNSGKTSTITSGGVYYLGEGAAGLITVSTTDAVTLMGTGASTGDIYNNLYIYCAVPGVNLTLQDVYISNTVGRTNMINYQGGNNRLSFAGTSILDQNTNAAGYAMVHVNSSTDLTVTGGTAYFYKREQGAGIGGNGGADGSEGMAPEYNGDITVSGATLFMKNSKQGALIGSGAGANSAQFTPGAITIDGSVLNLIGVSRGAVIGGSAGSGGAAKGTTVNIRGSSVNINVDWTGAAIGGGGFDAGNDSDGGTLYADGSSVRAFIDSNATGSWGVPSAGVNNNKAITAEVYTADGEKAYLLTFDTSGLSGGSFTVKEGGTVIYSGGLHEWSYIDEDLGKYSQSEVEYTIDNWTRSSDRNLYLYVTGETHELTVESGGTVKSFTAAWDPAGKTFTVTNENDEVVGGGPGGAITPENTAEAESTTVVENGTATTTVSDGVLSSVLEDADKNTYIEIKTTLPGNAGGVSTVITELSSGAAEDIADQTGGGVINTPLGVITIPSETLRELVSAGGGGSVIRIIIETADLETVSIRMTAGGVTVASLRNPYRAAITVPDSLRVPLSSGTDSPVNQVSPHLVVTEVFEGGGEPVQKSIVLNYIAYFVTDKPELSVTVTDNRKAFGDVAAGAWYYNGISFASSHELMTGTTGGGFSPNTPMTRAMLVTVLYRLENEPQVSPGALFDDVESGSWYTDAIAWASGNGIVDGYNETTFGTNDVITREQLAAMLYRYARHLGMDVSASADLSTFTDGAATSGWAADAMKWAIGGGLISGTTGTTLLPQGDAARSQVAAILMRLIAVMVK